MTEKQVKQLHNDYEKVRDAYRGYLKKYPQSIHAGAIRQKTAPQIPVAQPRLGACPIS